MADATLAEMLAAAGLDQLTFNPSVATAAMNTCSNTIATLLAIRNQADKTRDSIKDFAGPSPEIASGHKWAEGFRQLAAQAGVILGENISTVQAMADLYRDAAKTFQNSEDESVQSFTKIKMATEARTGLPAVDYSSRVEPHIPAPKTIMNKTLLPGEASQNWTLPNDDRALSPENSTSLGWSTLYTLGTIIDANDVVRLADEFKWMKTQLTSALTTFKSEIVDNPTFKNQWVGLSAQSAERAGGNYVTAATDFANKLGDIDSRLRTSASWLLAAKNAMPKTASPPQMTKENNYWVYDSGGAHWSMGDTEQECLDNLLKIYRMDFDSTYLPGLYDYNSTLVKFEVFPTKGLPTASIPSQPQVNPAAVPNTNGGGGGNNTGGGGGGVPSVPVNTDEQQKAAEEAAKTAADEAAKKAAEEAAKTAAEEAAKQASEATTKQSEALQSLLSTGSEALTSALSAGSEALQSVVTQGLSGLTSLADQLTTAVKEITEPTTEQPEVQPVPTTPTTPGVPTTTGGGGGGGGGGVPTGAAPVQNSPQTKLFPRAAVSVDETATTTTSRAGLASTTTGGTTSSGTPMAASPMGAGAAQGAGQGKEQKRPDYLRSSENIKEALGVLPEASTPVADR
ncbi:hypothetical protein [Nocardia sp. NPDC057668]|uniref:hypothetical protein n=1 Tax=Nocardia sp. NPDC057668 TaxID=3346202 RepID=UPI00366E9964